MSIGYGNSHQHVGLNRCGAYLETVPRSAGVSPASRSGKHAGETPALQRTPGGRNEKWRRITNIVGRNTLTFTVQQRKKGIRRLVRWMEGKLNSKFQEPNSNENEKWKSENFETAPRCAQKLSITSEWGAEIEKWGGVRHAGRSVESLCVELGITQAKLSGLLREGFGLSASEIVDGIKIRGLKNLLMGQLKEAAWKLWGAAGSFAQVRCYLPLSSGEGERSSLGRPARAPDLGRDARGTAKRSKYFRTRAEEFFGVLPGDEERIRIRELLGALDSLREENDFLIDNLALQLGFDSAARFRKACWTVMGRSLEQLEKLLAHEIVDFYLAAEDRELRELARRNPAGAESPGHYIYAAREIYCGDAETVPEAPFLDRWSAMEFGRPEWLAAMRKEFG